MDQIEKETQEEFRKKVGSEVKKAHSKISNEVHGSPVEVELDGTPVTNSFYASVVNPDAEEEIRRWSTNGDVFWPASKTTNSLPAGYYRFGSSNTIGSHLQLVKIPIDDLLKLPDTASEEILLEFLEFWKLKANFEKYGLLHRRGILLWGPPGSGKTASLMLMAAEIIKNQNGIVCQIAHPGLAVECLQQIRRIEPLRPIMALLEDIDALIHQWGESQYLALLDGESQVDNIVYVATTNYPEKLDKRVVDRPSRFDSIKYVGMPSADARRFYFKAKLPEITRGNLDLWVDATGGYSIAHLRELLILIQCFNRPFEAAIERLSYMRESLPNSEKSPDKPKIGFR